MTKADVITAAKITDEYRAFISRNPNVLAVIFIGFHPVQVISKDIGFANEKQFILTRNEVLGDFEERKNK